MKPLDLAQRAEAALQRIRDGHSPMRIPADPTDPDIVIVDLLTERDRATRAAETWEKVATTAIDGHAATLALLRNTEAKVAEAERERDRYLAALERIARADMSHGLNPVEDAREALGGGE